MKNWLTIGVAVGAAMAMVWPAEATTLAWYHFNESGAADGTAMTKGSPSVLNAVDSTKFKVTPYSRSWTALSTNYDYIRYKKSFPTGVKLYDPVSKVTMVNELGCDTIGGSALTGDDAVTQCGTLIYANDDGALDRTVFTVEAFVCLPTGVTRPGSSFINPIIQRCQTDTYDARENPYWSMGERNGSLYCRFYVGGSQYNISCGSSAVLTDGKWHHVALVVNEKTATVYYDYTYSKSTTLPNVIAYTNTGDILSGGAYQMGKVGKFRGYIDEVRFSDTALTPDQFLRFIDENYGIKPMTDVACWYGTEKFPADYWMTMNGFVDRVWANLDGWTIAGYAYGHGDTAMTIRGAWTNEVIGSPLWTKFRGESFVNSGSFRTITNETVTAAIQNNSDMFIIKPPKSNFTPLTDGSFTIEFFFKPNGHSKLEGTDAANLLSWPNNVATDPEKGVYRTGQILVSLYMLNETYSDQLKVYLRDSDGHGYYLSVCSGLSVTDWHHCALVYDKSKPTFSVYVDRELKLSKSITLDDSSSGLVFGAKGTMWGLNAGFDGWIDEVRIMRKVLAPKDFIQIASHGAILMVR